MAKPKTILIAGPHRSGTGDDPHKLAANVRILGKCDGVLRVGGTSAGADQMLEIARQKGLKTLRSWKKARLQSKQPRKQEQKRSCFLFQPNFVRNMTTGTGI